MERKQLATGIGSFIGLLILILDGKIALQGAQTGIELCLKTVIPSLFPFFLLSILLTQSLSGIRLSPLRPLCKILGIPSGAESVLIPSFLGGYPAGAQSIGICFRSGRINKENAERLLSFCNNAGPSFLFGIVSGMFSEPGTVWVLWGIHVVSALLSGLILSDSSDTAGGIQSQCAVLSVSESLFQATKIMAAVCGWVIIFRVIIAFLSNWVLWLLPNSLQVLIIGLLELSNGCCELKTVADPALRFLICSIMLSSGGICVAMQTQAVIGKLSMKYYFHGKLLQTAFGVLLSIAFLRKDIIPVCSVLIMITVFLWKKKKRSSFQKLVGV